MAEISEKTKKWLLDKYRAYSEDLHDSRYWEYEHKRAEELLGILGEIITELGIEK